MSDYFGLSIYLDDDNQLLKHKLLICILSVDEVRCVVF